VPGQGGGGPGGSTLGGGGPVADFPPMVRSAGRSKADSMVFLWRTLAKVELEAQWSYGLLGNIGSFGEDVVRVLFYHAIDEKTSI